jgi:hypothetical protein
MTLAELLEDPIYLKYFRTVPHLPAGPRMSEPWRVYVQLEVDGPWARKHFWTYKEAYRWLKPKLEGYHDATIQSKGVAYKPPMKIVKVSRRGVPVMINTPSGPVQKTTEIVWKPHLPEGETMHTWCCYCRRPTIFKWFSKHHAFRGTNQLFDPTLRRCTICGASELLVAGMH